MLTGTIQHKIMEYQNKNWEEYEKSLLSLKTAKQFKKHSINLSLLDKDVRSSLYMFNNDEQEEIKNNIKSLNMRDAEIEHFSTKFKRGEDIFFRIYLSEAEFTGSVELTFGDEKILVHLSGHPDMIFHTMRGMEVWDYKSGHPARLIDWIHYSEYIQLDGYSYLYNILNQNDPPINVGTIVYLQIRGSLYDKRPIITEPKRFEEPLTQIAGWYLETTNPPTPCKSYKCKACSFFKKECQV